MVSEMVSTGLVKRLENSARPACSGFLDRVRKFDSCRGHVAADCGVAVREARGPPPA